MYGARVKNNDNIIQIDGLYSDMVVAAEGVYAPNSYTADPPTYRNLPAGIPNDCMIVFRPESNSTDGAAWGDFEPANRRFYFRARPAPYAPGNIRYRILVRESQAAETGGLYGMRIKKTGTGELVFSSRRTNRLKVGGVIVATGGPPAPFVYTLPVDRECWALLNDPGLYGFAYDETDWPPLLRMYRSAYHFNWDGFQNRVLISNYFDGGGWAGLTPIQINTQRTFMLCYF